MLKLMIVDDEQWVLDGLRCQIDWEKLGVSIICEAVNGLDARDKLNIYRPDMVLTDISMPMMDGLDLVQYIRDHHPDCAVVIMSGYADFNYAQKAMQFGVTGFILKPIDRDELEEAVCQAVQIIDERSKLQQLRKKSDYDQEDACKWAALKGGERLPEGGRMFLIGFEGAPSTEVREYMNQYLHDRCRCFIRTQDGQNSYLGICTKEQSEDIRKMGKILKHMLAGIDIPANIIISSIEGWLLRIDPPVLRQWNGT